MRYPWFGAADENSSAICILSIPPVVVLSPSYSAGPAKLIWHLQIAWRWNHITVFRFQFYSLGKYCFKPLLFIKGTSYPLYAAIVLHGPCLQLCPWDNSIRDVQAAELLLCSHKGPQCNDQILKWFLHRNFIIIMGVKCIKHHSLDEMFICWNGVAYKVLGYCDLPYCLCWIFSVSVRLAQHQRSMPAPHSSSLLASCMERHKLQPWWIHAALILSKTVRGYMGNPASYLGGRMISPTYPY